MNLTHPTALISGGLPSLGEERGRGRVGLIPNYFIHAQTDTHISIWVIPNPE